MQTQVWSSAASWGSGSELARSPWCLPQNVTTHTYHARCWALSPLCSLISHLASPDHHQRPTPCGFLSAFRPPVTVHSGCKTLELVTVNVHAAMMPSDTREMEQQSHCCRKWGMGVRSEKHGKPLVTWADSKAIHGTTPFLD